MAGNNAKNLINDLIEVIGIDEELPKYSRYFKQFQVQEVCNIPNEKPDIEKILRLIVSVEIIFTKIISTSKGISNEGQKLTGIKLLVRGKLIQKLEYIATGPQQAVHAAEFENPFSTYIVLDECILNNGTFEVTPYIEDIYIKQIDKRSVFKNITIFLNVSPSICKINRHDDIEENLFSRHKKHKHHKNHLCTHKNIKYFTQFVVSEFAEVPTIKPDIEQVISVIVEPEIISKKVINTPIGVSIEGQHLSGKKIVVELKIKQKILYVANVKEQPVHGFENEFYQSAYVVIPKYIEGTDVEVLLKNNLLQPVLKVEDVYFKQIDNRKIFKNITLLLEFNYIPTYEVCYCEHNNCTSSNLWLIYENGKNPCQITFNEDRKFIKPLWSPNGQNIAFLSQQDSKEKFMLSYINLKSLKQYQLTHPYEFDSITSFSWIEDSRRIVFSGIQNNCKDIFIIDIEKLEIKQLTKGKGLMKNYKPKCSSDGSKVAYLRSINNITNIWVMDINGFNNVQITKSGYIKDFEWLDDNKIVYVWGKSTTSSSMVIVDLMNLDVNEINIPDYLCIKKCLKASPNKKYIAFIGAKFDKKNADDIYIYDIKNKALVNLTEYCNAVDISDFEWKIDSSKIYYSANEEVFYNLYSISLIDFCKTQLTNITASNIELSYRPRVK